MPQRGQFCQLPVLLPSEANQIFGRQQGERRKKIMTKAVYENNDISDSLGASADKK